MPVLLRPDSTYEITLDGDADIEESSRPVFIGRHVSGEITLILAESHDKMISESLTGPEAVNEIFKVLSLCLVGWKNMGDFGEYESAKLIKLLTMEEAKELLEKAMAASSVSDEDEGKSE